MSKAVTWRVIRSANDPMFMVKGYELADCFYAGYRFRIAEVRAMFSDDSADGYYMGVRYRVFDAHTVTDAEIREGITARPIGTFDTYDDAIKFCDNV